MLELDQVEAGADPELNDLGHGRGRQLGLRHRRGRRAGARSRDGHGERRGRGRRRRREGRDRGERLARRQRELALALLEVGVSRVELTRKGIELGGLGLELGGRPVELAGRLLDLPLARPELARALREHQLPRRDRRDPPVELALPRDDLPVACLEVAQVLPRLHHPLLLGEQLAHPPVDALSELLRLGVTAVRPAAAQQSRGEHEQSQEHRGPEGDGDPARATASARGP